MKRHLEKITDGDATVLERNEEVALRCSQLLLYARYVCFHVFLQCATGMNGGITENHKRRWLLIQLAPTILPILPEKPDIFIAFGRKSLLRVSREKHLYEVSARTRIPENYRVCWGPLQTRKDTRQILRPLYNYPFGIQALFFFFFLGDACGSARNVLGAACGHYSQGARYASASRPEHGARLAATKPESNGHESGPPPTRHREFSRTLVVVLVSRHRSSKPESTGISNP